MKVKIQKLPLRTAFLLVLSTLYLQSSTCFAQGTAFTYQGRLLTTNGPAHGTYDLTFALFNAASGGSQIGSIVTDAGQFITNGLFTFTMDFGAGIFDGTTYWLHIGVRTNGAASFATLSPRQELTPTPYAITAGHVASGALPPTYSNPVNFDNAGNSFSGNGAGLTSLDADNLAGGTVPDARLSANVALLDRDQTFTGNQTFAGQLVVPSPTADIYSGSQTLLRSDGTNDNFFAGLGAGHLTVNGSANTGNGFEALYSNTNGTGNTANGAFALQSNTSGGYNTAIGFDALEDNTSGNNNTAGGVGALQYNTTGEFNTAMGVSALSLNTNGVANTANGYLALEDNTSGSYNTASGLGAMAGNTSGSNNVANGFGALRVNAAGSFNAANGSEALAENQGFRNTASGCQALYANTTGYYNTACGYQALYELTTGSDNTALGRLAGRNIRMGSDNIDIGSEGLAGDSGTIRIGEDTYQTNQTFIAGIYGKTIPSGVPVYVNSSGQLGTLTSSARFKQDIQNMSDASDVLYSLQPVTFRYKPGIDPAGTPEFGLVAEQVEKVDPALVVRDKTGQPYTVRYQAVDAMLLNEFLKEHQKVEDLEARVEKLEQLLNAKNGGAQ
jgi:Chaperone of endosialidase